MAATPPELSRLNGEYAELIKEFSLRAARHFGDNLTSICVFGSVARGESDEESDLDIMVVANGLPEDVGVRYRDTADMRSEVKLTEAYKKLRATEKCAQISEVYLTPEEVSKHPPLLLDIVEDGLIVYDKNGFLQEVLSDIKARLRELGAIRVKARKGRYWILKPDAKLGEVVRI